MLRGSAMLQSHKYSVIETLRDGHRLEIRALTSDDRSDLIAAVARTSAESLRRRFFVPKRSFTDQETANARWSAPKIKLRWVRSRSRCLQHMCFESGGQETRSDPNRTSRVLRTPARWIGCFERCLRMVCMPEILISLMLAREAGDGIVRQGVVMAVKNAFYAQSGGV